MNHINRSLLTAFLLLIGLPLVAQQGPTAKPNWQNLDWKTDGVFGVSTEKAYTKLLTGKRSGPVIVAVIDGGIDISHEDLQGVIWTNKKESPGNGKDDDGNGYIDDIHGWNFLGSSKGDIEKENEETIRMIRTFKARFGDNDNMKVSEEDLPDFNKYLALKAEVASRRAKEIQSLSNIESFMEVAKSILTKMGKENPTLEDFKAFVPANADQEALLQRFIIPALGQYPDYATYWKTQVEESLKRSRQLIDYTLNIDYDPRASAPEEYAASKGQYYGNANVTGPVPIHGTLVVGIIAALRDNATGIKGVANNVLIMPIRTIPDGDERDRDVASAIRYAADNGAKVINMSFGKTISPDKKLVDEAVRYACTKDVLFVHAAGNAGKNREEYTVYPNRQYADNSGSAGAWIEVGASGFTNDENLLPLFTNYGKKTVDLFAPGVAINSTLPDNSYGEESGTSMAAPVVSGVAALIRSYYPKLSAKQVKEIILKSVTKVPQPIKVKGDYVMKSLPLSEVCTSGGVLNAYEALKLAATYK